MSDADTPRLADGRDTAASPGTMFVVSAELRVVTVRHQSGVPYGSNGRRCRNYQWPIRA